MKRTPTQSLAGFAAAAFFTLAVCQLHAQAMTPIPPRTVLEAMQHVADWELANSPTNDVTGWVAAAGDAGMMALANMSGDTKYRDAMLAKAEADQWKLGKRIYHADDQCEGQMYTELYLLYQSPKMIAPLRERFDYILSHPSDAPSLDFKQPHAKATELWSWCDSLFMAPPAWVRLYEATGDQRYLDFAVSNWWRTTDFLYDQKEHLFYRDSTFFKKREANGQKVFWSRGNGWVMAGLVRVLQYLPMNHPDRPRFEQLFKDMAAKVLLCRQPDGLWRASLLDPENFPLKETSGSGFFTYALAWGVNQGLLDRATYEPAVQKAWLALAGCVDADGKLTHVQPVGGDPKKFREDATAPYGVGAFLLAGSEVYRMEILETTGASAMIKVTNPSNFWRENETVEVNLGGAVAVMDRASSRLLDSQVYSPEPGTEKLLFQVDLAPGETRMYCVLPAPALAALPPPIIKTFARFVPERHDDFAWESDRIAHRMYGKALETWAAEPLTSSGVDVWIKRTRNLVINQMYGSGIFNLSGVSQDDYRVGKTRGDGGLGVWDGEKLHPSANFRTWRVITTGPIRSEFELTYDAWDAGNGRMVSEVKRISIDAGSNLSHVKSTFSSDDKSPLTIGVGVAERPGNNLTVTDGAPEISSWQSSTDKGLIVQNQAAGWQAYWQPQDFAKGSTAVAFILPKGSIQTFTNDNPNLSAAKLAPPKHTVGEGQPPLRNLLAVTSAEIGQPFDYYLGAGWDASGDFPDAKSWVDYIRRFAERRDQPLQVQVLTR